MGKDNFCKMFPLTSVCRDDILQAGFKRKYVEKLSDDDMVWLARKITDSIMEDYWLAIDVFMNEILEERKVVNKKLK